MRRVAALCVLPLVLMTVACTAGPNELVDLPDAEGEIAGFWLGLWHGFIAPFAFIASLIFDGVHIYETHNTGGWYNFGFLFGLSCIFGGSGGKAAKRKKAASS